MALPIGSRVAHGDLDDRGTVVARNPDGTVTVVFKRHGPLEVYPSCLTVLPHPASSLDFRW